MNDAGELPIFRPRFGRGRGAAGRVQSTGFRNALLTAIRATGRAWRRDARIGARRARIAVRAPTALARRVVVKAHFVKMTRYGAKAAALHMRYIARDGVERDGSRASLYGPKGPIREDDFNEPRPGEKHQFRLIVSPEDAHELHLTDYIRRYMAGVERDVGRKLEWAAVNHYDTDHPHVHVVVRGVDARGEPVRFDREYISRGLRWRAQELATHDLGPRTEREVRRARDKEVAQERYTSLDRDIERRAQGHVITVRDKVRPREDDSILVARLEHLERLRLAERLSPTSWRLTEGWSAHLRETGARGDIIKQMHAALRGDPARYQILAAGKRIEPTPSEPQGLLYGRVASKGLSDELRGQFYAIIETPGGGGYHVALDKGAAQAVREGDLVCFETKPTGDGRPPGSYRVVVRKQELGLDAQVEHRGPTPLDRWAEGPLAPYGFGAQVQAAVDLRRQVLRSLGIEPSDPDRVPKLLELERRSIGQAVASRTQRAFVSDTPAVFQGRVQMHERGGSSYAVVIDGHRFVVVPATADLRARQGQAVTLVRDRDGRMHVREPDKDRDR